MVPQLLKKLLNSTVLKSIEVHRQVMERNNNNVSHSPVNGIMSFPCICLIACHIHGTMYRVASICFCISQRCTSHRTMYMTCYKTYTWIRHDSVNPLAYYFLQHMAHLQILIFRRKWQSCTFIFYSCKINF